MKEKGDARMKRDELNEIVKLHSMWAREETAGVPAHPHRGHP